MAPEDEVRHGCGQEDEPRDAGEEVQHRAEVAESLRKPETAPEERVVHPEDLGHPARPADALTDVRGERLGLQPRRLGHAEVRRAPAAAMHPERGVRVLGDRLDRDSAHVLECRAAEHGARTAEEGRIPGVQARLDDAVEQLVLGGHTPCGAQVPAIRVRRVEVVRRLHQREARVAQEPSHRHLEERADRHVIAVEDGDELRVGNRQCMVQVSGFRVRVVAPGDVSDSRLGRESPERITPAIVEEVHAEPILRPIHRGGGEHGRAYDRQRLVVGRDEDVHRGPPRRIWRQRDRPPAQRCGGLVIGEQQHRA